MFSPKMEELQKRLRAIEPPHDIVKIIEIRSIVAEMEETAEQMYADFMDSAQKLYEATDPILEKLAETAKYN